MCNMRRGNRGFLLTREASASGTVAGQCPSGDGKHGEMLNRQSEGSDRSLSRDQKDFKPKSLPARLSPRLPAARQRGWEFLARPGRHEECADVAFQSRSQPFQHGDGWVFHAPFEAAGIGPVDAGINGKVLLGEAAFNPQLANIVGDKLLSLHPLEESGL